MAISQSAMPSSVDAQWDRALPDQMLTRMTPVSFNGCFGWYHPAAQPSSLAVLLCPPLGREARWTHRMFRKLATRLAAAGLPSLRFDYPNSGDSGDVPAGEDPLAAWRDSVDIAADWLRAQSGAGELAFVGLRFGALLAADAAAARTDVAALALLAPVVSGRTYVRELKTLARLAEAGSQATDPTEMDGLPLADATLQAMSAMAMPRIAAPARQILALEHGSSANAYLTALAGFGVAVTATPFAGYTDLMRSAVSNLTPDADIDHVVAWLARLDRTGAATPAPHLPVMTLRTPGCLERGLAFGADQQLFGILCCPDRETLPETVVIIGNSGGDPHTGISRFSVTLARRLAAQGIASLRMDFAGLGDSVRGADDRDAHVFATDRRGDFDAAIDALTPLGFRQIGAFGLCTGAYHALEAAVVNQRIGLLAMINLPTFSWQQDDPVDLSVPTQFRSSAAYREGLKDWKNWSRMLRGDVAIREILTVMMQRAAHRGVLLGIRLTEKLGLDLGTNLARPRRTIRGLIQRGVKIQVLLSFGDPGIDTLEAYFGSGGRGLVALGNAEVTIRHGLDHTLSLQRMRDDAVVVVSDFFARMTRPG
jgi:alpha/beta superfamily hydrolase